MAVCIIYIHLVPLTNHRCRIEKSYIFLPESECLSSCVYVSFHGCKYGVHATLISPGGQIQPKNSWLTCCVHSGGGVVKMGVGC